MATTSISPRTDWREEWFEFEDATYLNLAGESPMPKVSLRAIQGAIADSAGANSAWSRRPADG